MPRSKSILAYPDIKEAFDRAIQSENGVKLTFEDEKAMYRFMFRCFGFRKADSEHNKILYPDPGHTMHGRSIYDVLRVKDDKEEKALYIEKIKSFGYKTEEI